MPAVGTGPLSLIVHAAEHQVQSLALTLDGSIVPVEVRKQFKPQDGFANLPVLVVAAEKSGKGDRLFGPTWAVPYGVTVALVVMGRLDFGGLTTGELGSEFDWVTQLQARLREPQNWGLYFVMAVSANLDPPISKEFSERGWDVQAAHFDLLAMEDDGENDVL